MSNLGDFGRPGLALLVLAGLVHAQQPPQESDKVPTFGTTVVLSSGLRGDIYFLAPDTNSLPRFRLHKRVGTIYTTSLNIPTRDFHEGFPGITDRVEYFGIDYKGRFWIESGGSYRFLLNSDDGAKLYLDGKLMIDNDGLHSPSSCTADVDLSRGTHNMRVAYFQGPRFQISLILSIAKPGEPWRVFDTNDFKPSEESAESGVQAARSLARPARRILGGRCAIE